MPIYMSPNDRKHEKDLTLHISHHNDVVGYQGDEGPVVNVAVECETCGVALEDIEYEEAFDAPDVMGEFERLLEHQGHEIAIMSVGEDVVRVVCYEDGEILMATEQQERMVLNEIVFA